MPIQKKTPSPIRSTHKTIALWLVIVLAVLSIDLTGLPILWSLR